MAVGLAAALLLAFFGFLSFYDPVTRYETGIGERQVAMLTDGSKISLDADTKVDVRMRDNKRELALLRGRAKFDVARDALRPFSVRVGDKVVVATGTSFSVEMLQQQARVLLYEGHVAVLDRKTDQPVPKGELQGRVIAADTILTPGRELIVSLDGTASAARVASVDTGQSLSWEAGQLAFEDEPLELAAARVNRYSANKLVIADPGTAKLRVTGVFDAGDLDAFVEAVTAFNDVQVTRKAGEITLRHK